MNSPEIKYLIVDRNKCYAGLLKEALTKYTPDCIVDIAADIWQLKRRLKINGYKKIFADCGSDIDGQIIKETLAGVHTPRLVWTHNNKPDTKLLDEIAHKVA